MQIEFDQAKDVANQTKHGVSLALADELNWEAALVWVDDSLRVRRVAHDRTRSKDGHPLLRGIC